VREVVLARESQLLRALLRDAMTDAIKLTVPHQKSYYGVVRLVVGGLAARLDLTYEYLEDLQIALESLLANQAYVAGDEVTIELAVSPGSVQLLVGPLDGGRLRPDLAADSDSDAGVTLGRLLSTVVGDVEIEEREGSHWVRLEKRMPGAGVAASP
jgi:anti-sigma regulatory factor (Ser/Thr protein kinase)